MRSLQHIIAALLLTLTLPLGSSAQFVTLEGRRFMLDGQEFYPVVLNYGIEFVADDYGDDEPEEIYYSPMHELDRIPQNHFECTGSASCDQQLREHFDKIVEMGFNTIRLVGAAPEAFRTSGGERLYKLKVRDIAPYGNHYHVGLSTAGTAFTDPMSDRYAYLVSNMLDAAEDAGLKVILLTGTEVKTWPISEDQVEYDWDEAVLYSKLLEKLAAQLHDHPALLAYDLINEPAWRYSNTNLTQLSKSEVCDYTSLWYDAITGEDPNHLVTVGGAGKHDIGAWDPAVMKIDFYSPHPYMEEDWDFIGAYDVTVTIDRYMAELYWLGATTEMPWLVGETSFSANDGSTDYNNDTNYVCLDGAPEHHAMPYMHGSEAEQAAFVGDVLAATRNFRGSGFSWWYMQDGRSNPYQSAASGQIRSNYFGALGYGDGTNRWRDKPMVDVVQAYQPEPLPEELPEPPPAYWNWHGPMATLGTYTIVQQSGPVQNAISLAKWEYRKPNPNGGPQPIKEYAFLRSVSNASGSMNLTFPPATRGQFTRFALRDITIDASGGHRIGFESPENPPLGSSIPLETSRLLFRRTIGPLELISVPSHKLAAWSELTLSNTTVLQSGFVDTIRAYARESVHLIDECHFGNGTEAHIACRRVFADCGEQPYQMPAQPISPNPPLESKALRRRQADPVQLNFQPRNAKLEAWPNPCTDLVWIRTDESASLIEVYDAYGRTIAAERINEGRGLVRTVDWSPGLYHVRLKDAIEIRGVSFIKTP